jgi:1,4-alpha-glucan branching enzyme
VSFVRKSRHGGDLILVVCNFTPVPRLHYAVGVPRGGYWRELLNSDAEIYGGSGMGNFGGLQAATPGAHGRDHALRVTLPPLAAVFFKST